MAPGERVWVHSGNGSNTHHHRYWGRYGYAWNNTGDTAKLRRKDGFLTDSCA